MRTKRRLQTIRERLLKPFLRVLRGFVFTLVVVAFSTSGWLAFIYSRSEVSSAQKPVSGKESRLEYELVRATPPPSLALSGSSDCVEPTARETALIHAAVEALAFGGQEAGYLSIGAQKLLSAGRWRSGQNGDRKLVCDNPESYERAGQLIDTNKLLLKGRVVEYGLNLIARLPNPSHELVQVVAGSAFNDIPQEAERSYGRRDIRPLARATLASLGRTAAAPYADQAFAQISLDDSMGTGAAQIAVSGGHPDALKTVEELMTRTLDTLPDDQVVPWDIRNRLYELAYALTFAGDAAKEHITPLRDLMGRKVESWAPPFGMIERHPYRMCGVLARITQAAEAEIGVDYCAEPRPDT